MRAVPDAAVDGPLPPDAGTERPGGRRAVPLAHDPVRDEVVLFGGWGVDDARQFVGLDDFWLWRGGWRVATPAPRPPGRGSFGMVFHAADGVVVLLGGSAGGDTEEERVGRARADTWTWDGRAWTERVTPEYLGGRVDHALAYDAARGEVILFGGVSVVFRADTWAFRGGAWTERLVDGPTPRAYSSMAFDAERQRVVLFGGFDHHDVLGDTWLWDGQAWTEAHPEAAPPARRSTGLAWDPVSRRVLLFGGTPQGEAEETPGSSMRVPAYDDTWAWDGRQWVALAPAHHPPARRSFGMTTDLGRGRVLLFGGIRGNAPRDTGAELFEDQWSWDGQDWQPSW